MDLSYEEIKSMLGEGESREDGYEEYSDEWKKCNTKCSFCEGVIIDEDSNTTVAVIEAERKKFKEKSHWIFNNGSEDRRVMDGY